MESNLTKILIEKILGKVCIPPLDTLQRGMTLPFFGTHFHPPLWGPRALPPPPPPSRKTSLPLDPINAVKKLKILNFNIKQAKVYFQESSFDKKDY